MCPPRFLRAAVVHGLAALGLLGIIAGCAPKPPASDPAARAAYDRLNDPLEPTNRFLYRVNTAMDDAVFRPAARAYVFVLPTPVRTGVHNVLVNLRNPIQLANDVGEGKPRRAGDTFMRFLINSSVGVLGVFDVAAKWGYPPHDTDFGITLGVWGVPSGPFLFLPLLGPSSPRDAGGFAIDQGLDPFFYVPRGYGLLTLNWARYGFGALDTRARLLGDLDQIRKTALDPYATFRSLYRQHRASQIREIRNDDRATTPDWFTR